MTNFDLNLIMNAFLGNKAKDIVVIHPREIKSLVSSCLNGVNYNISIQEPEINAPAFTGQQLSILSHVIFVTLDIRAGAILKVTVARRKQDSYLASICS